LATSSLTCAVNLQSESAYAYTGSFSYKLQCKPGHLWLEPPVLCHWATTAGRPPTPTILLCILHRWY